MEITFEGEIIGGSPHRSELFVLVDEIAPDILHKFLSIGAEIELVSDNMADEEIDSDFDIAVIKKKKTPEANALNYIISKLEDIEGKLEFLFVKDQVRDKAAFTSIAHTMKDAKSIGWDIIDAITELQEKTAKADPKAHTTEQGEKIERSPFVHAESLKTRIMKIFDLEDGR